MFKPRPHRRRLPPRGRAGAHRPTVPIVREDALREYVLGLPPAPRPFSAADLERLFAPISPARGFSLPLLSR